jgi:hypothetical protein
MGGALLQLVALGSQDIPIVGNPQMTYFKSVYKRHTNFAVESIQQIFSNQIEFGVLSSCIVAKKGDMLKSLLLEIQLPEISNSVANNISWINGIGHHIIEKVELLIGGEIIQSMTGEFIDIYTELTIPSSQKIGYYKMVAKSTEYNVSSQTGAQHLYIPLPFWFCQNISQAIPLIALQYAEVKINVKFKDFSNCFYSGVNNPTTPTNKTFTDVFLYCDYVFLDVEERKKMAVDAEREYLITQTQISDGNPVKANESNVICDLYFNHPVKELLWVYHSSASANNNEYTNYSKNGNTDLIGEEEAPLKNVTLLLDNQDRFGKRSADYFRLVQPFQHHTSNYDQFIYNYSFALYPEKYQPSGTCNFSKIHATSLVIEPVSNISAGEIRVYAINYNILKVKNGIAGLMYSS